ncbi:SDR family NAD(P)-dependent oxidoreductase [Streptosporangium sp. NPDC049376]|uniref:SDR family NAD(P)-dependent oxidoreductase n=1 Tax=Streptosporangium sp. NPDC049376 TaxID=3366192 RepID=UPI003791EE93
MSASRGVAVVIGVGPGLGMSIAHRLGREGHPVVLVSRSDARHAGYVSSLADAGIRAEAFTADVRDHDRLLSVLDTVVERHGPVGMVYYGPGSTDPESHPVPILQAGPEDVRRAMEWAYPAVEVTRRVLPGMIERGEGGLLFATGLSAVMPMPALGNLAILSAALRTYAVTLNTALTETGVYAGCLVIGGVVERGDIHGMVSSQPERYGPVAGMTLDPDALADAAWEMYATRGRAEETFSVFG